MKIIIVADDIASDWNPDGSLRGKVRVRTRLEFDGAGERLEILLRVYGKESELSGPMKPEIARALGFQSSDIEIIS